LSSVNFCPFQSGYHSTETALLELLNDVYTAGDDRRCTVVIGLDISAAFDTISHKTLLHRLYAEFGLSSTAPDWVCSYLSDRRQYVKIGQHASGLFDCSSGVPQGSVLGSLLFVVYVPPVGNVMRVSASDINSTQTTLNCTCPVQVGGSGLAVTFVTLVTLILF